jgi:hypothetical protein
MTTGLLVGIILAEYSPSLFCSGSAARLVSDCDGALKEISFHYVQDFNEDCIETLSDLLTALPNEVAVRVVVAREEEFDFLRHELSQRNVDLRREMTAVVTGEPITPWAKDRFGTMRTWFGTPVLAVPPMRSRSSGCRANDERVPDRMSRELRRLNCRSLPFFFEGGDLLSDSTNVYVAANFLGRNQPRNKIDPEALMETIGGVLGRHVVSIGRDTGDVPDHHVGMYLTPLGDNTVAAGDPALGRDLWSLLVDQNPGVDVETNEACYTSFHRARNEVERHGLRIVRMPLILTRQPRVYLTYNNAILEIRSGEKRIYMPVYGIPAQDEAARRIYEAEGWRVFPVRVGKLYRHTGSLRCLIGIIRRA